MGNPPRIAIDAMGGDSGPAVVPGEPEKSLLIQAVTHTHERLKMPNAVPSLGATL